MLTVKKDETFNTRQWMSWSNIQPHRTQNQITWHLPTTSRQKSFKQVRMVAVRQSSYQSWFKIPSVTLFLYQTMTLAPGCTPPPSTSKTIVGQCLLMTKKDLFPTLQKKTILIIYGHNNIKEPKKTVKFKHNNKCQANWSQAQLNKIKQGSKLSWQGFI